MEAYSKAVYNWDFEPYQLAWAEALATTTRTAIICPPDSRKSTTVRMFVEKMIGLNPEISILWLMSAGSQSEKHVASVSQTIKYNPVYRRAFPAVEPDGDLFWNKSALYVKRKKVSPDPTLMATGLKGPYQGLHFNIIIIDDPTDQEDVSSPTTMMDQENKVRGVVLDRLLEGGRIVAIFTRWGTNDLFHVFQEIGFEIFQMPIVGDYPWGPTLSNTRFPMEVVEQKRRDKGDMLYQMTFMCNPEAASGNVLKREHIQYWDKLPDDRALQIFMGVDPAATEKTKNDMTAIATVGIDLKKPRPIYLLDMWAGRMEVPDLREEIAKRGQRTAGLRGMGLETIGFQISLIQDIRRKYRLPFKEIPYRTRKRTQMRVVAIDRNKIGRAMYLDSLFTSGRLFIPKGLPLADGVSLESELCSIGSGRGHDDRMDALSFACVLAEAAIPRRTVIGMGAFG